MTKNGFYGVMLDILILHKIIQEDLVVILTMKELSFLCKKKDFIKIEVQNNISVNVFGYEDKLVFPVYISNKNIDNSMDLLLLYEDDKSHYVYIKDFNTFIKINKK